MSQLRLLMHANVWSSLPVVVGDGNSSCLLASVDALAAVWDIALLRTSVIAGAGTSGRLVGIAGWAEINQAVRGLTMVLRRSTVALYIISILMFAQNSEKLTDPEQQ